MTGSRSSEDPVQEPAVAACLAVLAIACPEHPIALADLILDAEVVPHGDQFRIALPPFAEDPLGFIGAGHLAAEAPPDDPGRGMIGQQRRRNRNDPRKLNSPCQQHLTELKHDYPCRSCPDEG